MASVASISDVLAWLLGALGWIANNLAAPVLAGAVAGVAVPLAFRWESAPREVRQHDREIAELNEELGRFISDLERQVRGVARKGITQLALAHMQTELDEDEEADGETKSPQLSDALRRAWQKTKAERSVREAMADALWQYRDEAIRKRGQYVRIVESEGGRHERRRHRRQSDFPALRLKGDHRAVVSSWRSQPNPFGGDEEIQVHPDVTALELTILPLEQPEGFVWDEAQASMLRGDN